MVPNIKQNGRWLGPFANDWRVQIRIGIKFIIMKSLQTCKIIHLFVGQILAEVKILMVILALLLWYNPKQGSKSEILQGKYWPLLKLNGSIPESIVTSDKSNRTLIMCAFWKYYLGTWDLTFIRVSCNPAFRPSPSGSYTTLMKIKAVVTQSQNELLRNIRF